MIHLYVLCPFTGFISWIVWICLFKDPAWKNDLPQDSHLKSFWPSCNCIVWTCFFKSPAWENDLPQDSHLWSLWPSCTYYCVYVFLQTLCSFKWLNEITKIIANLIYYGALERAIHHFSRLKTLFLHSLNFPSFVKRGVSWYYSFADIVFIMLDT